LSGNGNECKPLLRGRLLADGVAVGGGGGGSGSGGGSGGDAPAHRTAYVQQDDLFYSQLTVEETLVMSAKMRMLAGTRRAERDAAVASLLQRLGRGVHSFTL
jgi:hypothetical protein